jgi:hypothetical protein
VTEPARLPKRFDPQLKRRARSIRDRASSAGTSAGTNAWKAGGALVAAVDRLVTRAIDRVLLTGERVTSAAEGKRLLAREADTEALAGDIQRVIVLAMPIVRTLARGARIMKVPWVMIGSTAVSVGIAVRTGVREIQVIASLVAHRVEQAAGTPCDPALVKKLAVDLYLHPKRKPKLTDDKLRLARLTRKWVLLGAFGRKTSKRAAKALDAAERLDAAGLHAEWTTMRRQAGAPLSERNDEAVEAPIGDAAAH